MKKLTALLAALACASLLSAAAIDVVETENAGEQTNAQDFTVQVLSEESESFNVTAVSHTDGASTDAAVFAIPAKKANSYVTLTADTDVAWSYTFSKNMTESQFTVEKTSSSIKFTVNTANANAGEITVNATANDGGVDHTNTYTVYVYGNNKAVPGLDITTGTEKPFDFENVVSDANSGMMSANGNIFVSSGVAVADSPDGNGKALAYNWANANFFTTYHDGLLAEKRPFNVSYKYYLKADVTENALNVIVNTDMPYQIAAQPNTTYPATSVYCKAGLDTTKNKWISENVKVEVTDKFKNLYKFGLYYNATNPNGTTAIYIDDFSVVPYYAARYHADSTVTEYFLLDGDGNILTEYTPVLPDGAALTVPDGKVLAGWTTENGGTEAMKAIPLDNADIDLYPVYKDTFKVSAVSHVDGASADSAVFAIPAKKANSYVTLTADTNVTWSYTFSKNMTESQFTVDETSNSIKFTVNTANANAGEITVNATVNDGGVDHTNTYTVYVYGNNKAVPGLDITTGTEKPFDFENVSSDQAVQMMSGSGNIFVSQGVAVADSPDGNGKALAFNWANANFFTAYHGGLQGELRPFNVSYKYYVKSNITTGSALNITVNTDMPANAASFVYGKAGLDTKNNKWISENVKVEVTDKFKNLYKFGLYYNATNPNGTTAIYIDDFSVVPYYAARYHADSTVTAYFLLDGDGNILTEYTPVLPAGAALTVPDGKVLAGWTAVNGGTEVMETIPLDNADIDLYPVFADKDFAPHWYNDSADAKEITEIRVQKDSVTGEVIDNKSGLRFKGYIEDVYRNDAKLTEYGFIVARTDILGSEQLTHGFETNAATIPFISQANYVKGGKTDLQLSYDTDLEATIFSCVLVNIPVEHYDDNFTVRTWSLVDGEYKYGAPVSVSILEILNSLEGDRKTAAQPLIDKYNEWKTSQAES